MEGGGGGGGVGGGGGTPRGKVAGRGRKKQKTSRPEKGSAVSDAIDTPVDLTQCEESRSSKHPGSGSGSSSSSSGSRSGSNKRHEHAEGGKGDTSDVADCLPDLQMGELAMPQEADANSLASGEASSTQSEEVSFGALETYVFDMLRLLPRFRGDNKASNEMTSELLSGSNEFIVDVAVGRNTKLDVTMTNLISENWQEALNDAIDRSHDPTLKKIPKIIHALYGSNYFRVKGVEKGGEITHHLALMCIYILKRSTLYEFTAITAMPASTQLLEQYPHVHSWTIRNTLCTLLAECGGGSVLLPDMKGFYRKGSPGLTGTLFQHLVMRTLGRHPKELKRLKKKRKRSYAEQKDFYLSLADDDIFKDELDALSDENAMYLAIDARTNALRRATWTMLYHSLCLEGSTDGFVALFQHSIRGDDVSNDALFNNMTFDEVAARSCVDSIILSSGVIGSCLNSPIYLLGEIGQNLRSQAFLKVASAVGLEAGDELLDFARARMEQLETAVARVDFHSREALQLGSDAYEKYVVMRRDAFVLFAAACANRELAAKRELTPEVKGALALVISDWSARAGSEQRQIENTTKPAYVEAVCLILSGLMCAKVMLRSDHTGSDETVKIYSCAPCRFDTIVLRIFQSSDAEKLLPVAKRGATVISQTRIDQDFLSTATLAASGSTSTSTSTTTTITNAQLAHAARRIVLMVLYHRGAEFLDWLRQHQAKK